MTSQFWPSGLRRQFKALFFGRGFESRRLYFFFARTSNPRTTVVVIFLFFGQATTRVAILVSLGPRWASSRTSLAPWSRHTQPVRHEKRAATPS